MINISNFTDPSPELFDLNLCQKEVDGGMINYHQIDEIEKYPDAKTIIISGLRQETFEYFVTKYANKFEAISFWKNKSVENLACLGELNKVKYINYFFNQRAIDLWNMAGNINLIGLGIYDFSRLHDIGRIETAPNLVNFHIGDKVTASMTIQSLKPIINTGIRHFEWLGKSVGDKDFICLSKSKIEELELNPTQFTMEELTSLLAYFPESLKGSITKPYTKIGIRDKDGYRVFYNLCKHKKMCEEGKDDQRFQNYLHEFELLLDEKRNLKMSERYVDNEIRLVPYYRNDEVSLAWYQDLDVCKQVDNRDEPYDLELLHSMYDYLCIHGDCYYIEYNGVLVGDVSLRDNGEVAIVICKEYQNRHIGRRCVKDMIILAKEKGMTRVRANIYSFNKQSQKMFKSIGFHSIGDEWFELNL